MKEIIRFAIGFAAFLIIFGSVGALELEHISFAQSIIQTLIGLVVLFICLFFNEIERRFLNRFR